VSALTPLMMMKYQNKKNREHLIHYCTKTYSKEKKIQTNTTNNMIKRQMTRKPKKRERDLQKKFTEQLMTV